MVTPDPSKLTSRIPALDGLRAFALVGVVIFHLLGISGIVTATGDSVHELVLWTIFGNTIDIFFILSGFVLFLPVIRRGGNPGPKSDFFLKRFSRLQPEYWACLVVLLLMVYFIDVPFQPAMPSFGNVLLHFFDLQTLWRSFGTLGVGFRIDGALWMVPVIAGLYLVFPFVARFYFRRIWLGLAIAALVTLAWKYAPDTFPGFFSWLSGGTLDQQSATIIAHDQTPAFFYSFAAGMAAAWIWALAASNAGHPWIRKGVILAFLIGIPAYVLVSIPFTHEALQSTTGFDGSSRGRGLGLNNLASTTVRTTLILGILLGPLWLNRPLASRPARWVAEHSFGIYLIHIPVAFYAVQLITFPPQGTVRSFLAWCAVVLPIAIAYAWVSRRAIGQPSVRWAENRIKQRRARLDLS